MRRDLYKGATFLVIIGLLGIGSSVLQRRAAVAAAGLQAPMFEVDPLWPKPLPNHWLLGMTIGVSVDGQDHIWIIHRQGSLERGELHATTNPPIAQCCAAAPPVLEFDQAGNLIGHWGSSGTGAALAKVMIGRAQTTESPSTIRATCGLAATAGARKGPPTRRRWPEEAASTITWS